MSIQTQRHPPIPPEQAKNQEKESDTTRGAGRPHVQGGHTDGKQDPTPTETRGFRCRHGAPEKQSNNHEASRWTDTRDGRTGTQMHTPRHEH